MRRSSVWRVTTIGSVAKSKPAKSIAAKVRRARTCWRVHGKPHQSKTTPDLMRVRWTPVAVDDLLSIANYLFEKTPAIAARLIRETYAVPPSLTRFPNSGGIGKQAG